MAADTRGNRDVGDGDDRAEKLKNYWHVAGMNCGDGDRLCIAGLALVSASGVPSVRTEDRKKNQQENKNDDPPEEPAPTGTSGGGKGLGVAALVAVAGAGRLLVHNRSVFPVHLDPDVLEKGTPLSVILL
ncbi:hypothetical protein GCM10010937_28890 [Gluconobacter japonicus]|uniref:Uncharacterized protein n=1 Tax=Gluconobacter japonicus TaxID=376620 RepID=A0ABQ5WLF9_GLUJA|nr:hypothetical protein AA3271_0574 [Gluconobacter japonicus NBRC 3271]GLQ61086.1 hypothetical protein GCM10010937_28890 [Gluconobacter japonicus]